MHDFVNELRSDNRCFCIKRTYIPTSQIYPTTLRALPMMPSLTSKSSIVGPSVSISHELRPILDRRGLGIQQHSLFGAGLPSKGCGSVVGVWNFRSRPIAVALKEASFHSQFLYIYSDAYSCFRSIAYPTAQGLDNIPAWFLCLLAPVISAWVAQLFNLSCPSTHIGYHLTGKHLSSVLYLRLLPLWHHRTTILYQWSRFCPGFWSGLWCNGTSIQQWRIH